MLAPPNLITVSTLSQVLPLPALARHLENLVPPPKPKTPSSALSPVNAPSVSAPKQMLATSGQVVTKYITKPAAQVVDPRNWSWPAYMNFGKGSTREKGKERGKTPAFDKPDAEVGGAPMAVSDPVSEHLAPPVDPESTSRASGSVSPSTVDHESLHESLLDAQRDSKPDNGVGVGNPVEGASSYSLPANPKVGDKMAVDPDNKSAEDATPEEAEQVQTTPRVVVKSSPPGSVVGSDHESNHAIEPPDNANLTVSHALSVAQGASTADGVEATAAPAEPRLDASQPTPPSPTNLELAVESIPAIPAAPALTPIQIEISTRSELETTSGAIHVWLDSLSATDVESAESGNAPVSKKRVAWIAVCLYF